MKNQLISEIKMTNKELRKFGIFIGLIILVICAILLWKNNTFYPVFIIIGLVLFGSGMAFPIILKPIYFIWMTFASIMGWLMTRVILSFVFYVVNTPIGLISRLFGKQFLELKWDRSKSTYWNARPKQKLEKEQFEKQF